MNTAPIRELNFEITKKELSMSNTDKFLQDHLNRPTEKELAQKAASQSSPTDEKKKGGGTGSFIVGFVFGILGVLVSFCWGGASAAFRGFLWRLGISLALFFISCLTRV